MSTDCRIMKYFQLNTILDYKSWTGKKVMLSGWGDMDEKKPPSKPDILQYATLEIWDPNECFSRWFEVEGPDVRPPNFGEQMKIGTISLTVARPFTILQNDNMTIS